MERAHEVQHVGLGALRAATELLQRVRSLHPTDGLYEAAELQWWWTIPRPTDHLEQLFWVDDDDRPVAAVVAADFSEGNSAVYEATTIVPIVLPGATADDVAHVVRRGFDHYRFLGIDAIELEVGRDDEDLRRTLRSVGFERFADGIVECWMDVGDRPRISHCPRGYELRRRAELVDRPHHLERDDRPDIERRLRQTSLYRPDLDLVVLGPDGEPAAYGLFWFDPVTRTGVVEPMRTHDDHQRRGLARHLLTAGVELLAQAGAQRVSICFEPDNPASGPLYRDVGFEPVVRTDLFAGSIAA